MIKIIIKLIALIIVLLGVILIYDARVITKKNFGFGDQNEASSRTKNIRIYDIYNWSINIIF